MKEKVKKNTEEVSEVKNKKKMSRKQKIGLTLLGILSVGAIILFTCTPYKLLFSLKKITFLGYINQDIDMASQVLNNIKGNQITEFITNKNSKVTNFDVNLNGKIVSGEASISDKIFTIKLNDITDNYVMLENKDLDKLWEKLDLSEEGLPSKIDFSKNPIKFSKLDKLRIYNFLTGSATDILNNLDSDKFILNAEATLDVNKETQNVKSIEVHLSETDIFMLQKEFLEALKDDGILNIFVNKINKISFTETIDKKEIKENIEKYITYLDYAKAYYELQDSENEYYIIYRMYLDDEEILARELIEKYTYNGTTYEDVICRLTTKKNDYYEAKWFSQEEYDSAYYNIISDKIALNENKQTHEIKYAIEGFSVGYNEEQTDYAYLPINSEVKYDVVIETLENDTTKVDITDETGIIKCALNYGKDNLNLSFGYANEEMPIDVNLTIKEQEFTKEALLNNGAMLINDKTQEELMLEFANIGSKLSEIFIEPESEQIAE